MHRQLGGGEQGFGLSVHHGGKLGHAGGVLHIAVAARLIELVRAQASASGWRIGLNSFALI